MNEHETPRITRNDPDSLAPLALDRLSVEEEVALMNPGKSRKLVGTAALCAIALAGGLFLMKSMDTRKAYADAVDGVELLREQHADAHLHCALVGIPAAKIASPEALKLVIEKVGERLGKSNAHKIERCAPMLRELAPALGALTVPSDVKGEIEALRSAATDLAAAWDGYGNYLADPDKKYEHAQTLPLIEKISLTWQAYGEREAALNAALRARM